MARAFSVTARVSSFELPVLTKQQIQALILDLDLDARQVVERAVYELWQREMGTAADRDIYAELDAIKAKLGMD